MLEQLCSALAETLRTKLMHAVSVITARIACFISKLHVVSTNAARDR